MSVKDRACSMRADGKSVAEIAKRLGIGLQWAYKCTDGVVVTEVPALRETARTVVRHFAHNGGYSGNSGMRPVSLPRIVSLHGALA